VLRVEVEVEGTRREALVNTGSSLTIVSRKVAVGGLRCDDSVCVHVCVWVCVCVCVPMRIGTQVIYILAADVSRALCFFKIYLLVTITPI